METNLSPRKKYHYYGRFDLNAKSDKSLRIDTPTFKRKVKVYLDHGYVSNEMLNALSEPSLAQKTTTEYVKAMWRNPYRYLDRPIAQRHYDRAKSTSIIHRLSAKGLDAMEEAEIITTAFKELYPKVFLKRKDKAADFWHDACAAHITGSVELGARESSVEFVPWHTYLMHERCPQMTRDADSPLKIEYPLGGKTLHITPDSLYGLRREGQRPQTHFLEFDNHTEKHADLKAKFRAYILIMHHRLHQKQLGFSDLHIDVVTNSIGRLPKIIKDFNEVCAEANIKVDPTKFRFKVVKALDKNTGKPWSATGYLFSTPWKDYKGNEVPLFA